MTTNTNDTTTETTALILTGRGYELTIAPHAEEQKKKLIAHGQTIISVNDNNDSARAQYASRQLAQMRIAVEKSRKEVKEPVNRIGKMIDQTAKDFVAEIEAEEKRITKLVGDHAAAVARLKAEREAEERKIMDEARRVREAAEEAAAQAQRSGTIADMIAARQAEDARQAAMKYRMAASDAVADATIADGVRFVWDFEILDIRALYRAEPDMVELSPKRSAILAALKSMDDSGQPAMIFGIRAFKKPVVSSR